MVKIMIKAIKQWFNFHELLDQDLKEQRIKGTKYFLLQIIPIVITLALFAVPYILVLYAVASIFSGIRTPIYVMLGFLPIYGNLACMVYSKFIYDLTVDFCSDSIALQNVKRSELVVGGLLCPITLLGFIILMVFLLFLF